MTDIQTAIEFVRQNRERYLEELKSIVSMPSVSNTDEH